MALLDTWSDIVGFVEVQPKQQQKIFSEILNQPKTWLVAD